MITLVQFGLQYTTGLNKDCLVGLDAASGNYPYPCHSLHYAWLDTNDEKLIKYRDQFQSDKFKLFKVTTHIEDVK